jgi:hypothetical protein
MSLDYHFKVEQEVSSSVCAFFGFNGEIHSCLRYHFLSFSCFKLY